MSFVVVKSDLDKEQKELIKKYCVVRPKATQYVEHPPPVYMFSTPKGKDEVVIPLNLYPHITGEFPNDTEYPAISAKFTKKLFTPETDTSGRKRDQQIVVETALAQLKDKHSSLLALHTGFGKTICAVWLTCALKLKTLVLCKQTSLHKQWLDAFQSFSTAKVQIIKDSALQIKLDPDVDVYIMGVLKAAKTPPDVFYDIGLLIVDEIHTVFANAYSRSLLNIYPQYLLGLSATPDRKDGLDKLFVPFFGDKKEYIVRKEIKNFTVIKYLTGFVPDITFNFKGALDWTNVINSLAYDGDRQALIANVVMEYPNEKIMILSRRIDEIKGVASLLKDKGVLVETLCGSKKREKLKEFRVLVASEAKAGVGFDDPTLTMLMLLTDSTDVRQFEGRIRQTENIVIDFVDNFPTLEKHWRKRKEWYKERGAKIIVKKF